MTKIAPLIVQNGCDVSESLAPISCGGDIRDNDDISYIKSIFSGKIAMMGGVDQMHIIGHGSTEQVRDEVHRMFETYGSDGGYVMMCSDHFFHAPKENLSAYAKAAKECLY